MKKKIVILSGAGMSAESGLKTFRDAGGLWEGHDVMEVASIQGWENNPGLVLDFYNQRREKAFNAKPNPGHDELARLEQDFEVAIITQNVDGLHEKAGSTTVIHLHGLLSQARSTLKPTLIYDMSGSEIHLGDLCEKGSQLRPNIVWFGEPVPMMEVAIKVVLEADLLLIVGTSMVVYPAAALVHYTHQSVPKIIVDPKIPELSQFKNIHTFEEPASTGVIKAANLIKTLLSE